MSLLTLVYIFKQDPWHVQLRMISQKELNMVCMIVIIKNSTDEYVPGLRGTTMDFKKNDNKL